MAVVPMGGSAVFFVLINTRYRTNAWGRFGWEKVFGVSRLAPGAEQHRTDMSPGNRENSCERPNELRRGDRHRGRFRLVLIGGGEVSEKTTLLSK